ncbi:hypothetical protein E2542_SST04659 [Spatholobus suberectus]|nr:hypothetical protein E2542_SST04659 [Spatholobus suberectus]
MNKTKKTKSNIFYKSDWKAFGPQDHEGTDKGVISFPFLCKPDPPMGQARVRLWCAGKCVNTLRYSQFPAPKPSFRGMAQLPCRECGGDGGAVEPHGGDGRRSCDLNRRARWRDYADLCRHVWIRASPEVTVARRMKKPCAKRRCEQKARHRGRRRWREE